MIFMTAPLFAAIANRLVLRQPTPFGLWPTCLFTVAGSVLVVVGQLQQNAEEGGAGVPSTGSLILGCALALTSTLLLTAYLVLIQVLAQLAPSHSSVARPRGLMAAAPALPRKGPCAFCAALPNPCAR